MTEQPHTNSDERDTASPPADGSPEDQDRPFLPDADAGETDADAYSRDEKGHGRQDYGP